MKILKEFARNPHLDWATILLVTVLLAGGLAFTSYTFYNAVVSGKIKASGSSRKTAFTKLDEKVIQSVIDTYQAREEKSAAARKAYTGAPDPAQQ